MGPILRSWITGTTNGHGYVLPPSQHVGAVLGDLDVSTCAAWSTGHSAIHSLVTRGPLAVWVRAGLRDGSVNPCVWTH